MLNSTIRKHRYGILSISILASSAITDTAFASCGSAFCSINTQWDIQGVSMDAGTRVGVRYESIDQDQLRSGTDKLSISDVSGEEHAEVETRNHNWLFSADHTINESWGVSVIIPYVDRSHEHIHDPAGAAEDERWDFKRLGDVRVTGKYKPADNPVGLLFGMKLPTGKHDITNDDGEEAERSLQPGTGTTDLILGAFHSTRSLKSPSSWFAQASWQEALNNSSDFKPGRHIGLDGGYRYDANHNVGLMIQLNGLIKGKDSGDEAEPDDSGGEFIFLSPGISITVSPKVQVYAFVQQPLYQHVNGIQLTADTGFVLGVNSRL